MLKMLKKKKCSKLLRNVGSQLRNILLDSLCADSVFKCAHVKSPAQSFD